MLDAAAIECWRVPECQTGRHFHFPAGYRVSWREFE